MTLTFIMCTLSRICFIFRVSFIHVYLADLYLASGLPKKKDFMDIAIKNYTHDRSYLNKSLRFGTLPAPVGCQQSDGW